MKIIRILAILLIAISLVFTACSSTASPTTPLPTTPAPTQQAPTSPPKTTPAPTQTPATIPKLEYQDDSFTIRVTGSRTVFDQRELDRRWGEAEKLADRLRDESYANENAEFKELLRLSLDGEISQEEYERRRTEMATRYETERNEIREEYFAVLHAPNDDLYSDSPNVKFSGSYMVVTSSGGTTSRSVDGTTPAEYTVSGLIVSCAFQKMSESGTLRVEILKDGKVINSSSTTADYGVVSLANE